MQCFLLLWLHLSHYEVISHVIDSIKLFNLSCLHTTLQILSMIIVRINAINYALLQSLYLLFSENVVFSKEFHGIQPKRGAAGGKTQSGNYDSHSKYSSKSPF